jgi:Xaa-Pro aminopeptidase
MICSNEPGYYKAGEYGIRIENLVVVRDLGAIQGGEKTMLGFETITRVPIDLNLVEAAMLTDAEKAWLNAYHADVRGTLTPVLADDAQAGAWLIQATKSI